MNKIFDMFKMNKITLGLTVVGTAVGAYTGMPQKLLSMLNPSSNQSKTESCSNNCEVVAKPNNNAVGNSS